MARYSWSRHHLPSGEAAIRLEDTVTGMDALVVPERGARWCALGTRTPAGQRVEMLYTEEDFDTFWGVPVLFPAVGRSRYGTVMGAYQHQGRTLPMPIHGFAKDSAWDLVASGSDAASAWVTCRLHDSQSTRPYYPYPFRLTLTYRLGEGVASIAAVVENPGGEPLPFHLGYHPYFRTPMLPGGDRRRCLLEVPSRAVWELDGLVATGQRLPLGPEEIWTPARPLRDAGLDQVFADLIPDEATGLVTTRLHDPDAGCTVQVEQDAAHSPVMVVYTDAQAPYVCLEPWTGLPGGLGDDTAAGRSARRLAPGGRFESTVNVRVTWD